MADDPVQPEPTPEPTPAPSPAEDVAAEALRAAQEAIAALNDQKDSVASSAPAPAAKADEPAAHGAKSFELPDFKPGGASDLPAGIALLADVNLNVKIELGRTRMYVEDVLRLAEGSVVELDKLAGDPVDVYVNDRHVARGEVLVLNDNFCVRISEVVVPVQREEQAA